MSLRRAYTFDEVALVPQFNNIPSRTEPSLDSWLTRNRRVRCPLVAANMDSVVGDRLAEVLIEAGTFPIFHRFTDIDTQRAWVRRYTERTFVSSGLRHLDQVRELLDLGAAGVCIDVAHGHSDQMMAFVRELKRTHPEHDVIAGNVCTPMAFHDLVNAGADAVKVGIGPGAACTTRMITGFGVPQFSAIRECAEVAEKLRVPLIADGGIRGSRDIVLALAAGASTVMIGKLFALTEESAAPKRDHEGRREAKYRGQASEDFQNDFYGGLKEYTVAEGTDFWAPVTGSARALMEELLGGLRSGMTYGGARNIKELQRKAEFVEVGPGYATESAPRKG
ncbi:MAG: guanosine monophosphate reductase [Ectothiorhodospiraceae bacterium]|nr:guanosine monophosphate reductase [Chromatiales bacterium]MCP5157505.1 guanosine monophosphate reductase [Ectothiorhodospiraceae bacterium]